MNNLKSYIFSSKKQFILICVLCILSAVFSLSSTLYIYFAISLLNTKENLNKFLILFAIFIALVILGCLFFYLTSLVSKKNAYRIKKLILEDFTNSILHLDYEDFYKMNVSEYVKLVSKDVDEACVKYVDSFFNIIFFLPVLVINLAFAIYLNYIMALIILFLSLIFVFLPFLLQSFVQKSHEKLFLAYNDFNVRVDNSFNGIMIIKNMLASKNVESLIYKENNKVYFAKNKLSFQMVFFGQVFNFAHELGKLIVMFIASILFYYSFFNLAVFATLIQIVYIIEEPVRFILISLFEIKSVKLVVDKISDIKPKKEVNKKDVSSFDSFILKDVSIKVKSKDLLSSTSFKFEKNKKYLLVGESGIGKTTLLETLIKHNSSYQGQIILDKIDLKDVSNNSINKLISYCQQKPYLFIGSLKDNITMFDNNVDEKQLKKVIKDCQLEDFAYKRGMDSILDNSKNTISLGEMQRISLARALYSKKEVLFLDEVTSSLDKDNVNKINDVIKNIKNKTIIWISHQNNDYDYSFIDEIVQIKNNKLIKEG